MGEVARISNHIFIFNIHLFHNVQKYGFLGYLSDSYDAPDAINSYLCQQKNLHEVIIRFYINRFILGIYFDLYVNLLIVIKIVF